VGFADLSAISAAKTISKRSDRKNAEVAPKLMTELVVIQ
jgi:hypothetical protein